MVYVHQYIMSHRWGEAKTLKFVQLYRQENCLWDLSHQLYRNNFTRDRSYRNIIMQMGDPCLTVPDVKTKIKNLRSTYYQELKKITDSKKTGEDYIPAVQWFHHLHPVMKDVAQMKANASLDTFPSTSIKQEPVTRLSECTTTNQEERCNQESPSSSTYVDNFAESSTFQECFQGGSLAKECDSFGKYVAACLMRLPAEYRFNAENSIFHLLMKEKSNAHKQRKRKYDISEENRNFLEDE